MHRIALIIAIAAFAVSPVAAQGNADGSAPPSLNSDQTTEILAVIKDAGVVAETNIDFEVSVGAKVPQNVTLLPLPLRAIQLLPQFEGYLFFMLPDGRTPIVSPDSLEIVIILG